MTSLLDFAVITIFAREVLEGSIIIGEYRTIILRTEDWHNPQLTQQQALREITLSAIFATILAIVICASVAIPLAILSSDFDDRTSKTIEGVSKIVAGICLLGLSLKLPRWLGIYESKKKWKKLREQQKEQRRQIQYATTDDVETGGDAGTVDGDVGTGDALPSSEEDKALSLTRRSIRFNVAWNIWREVAECGVFLIPFFLTGEGVIAIPLSAVVGSVVGLVLGLAIYFANHRLKDKRWLACFAASLLMIMSTGLLTGGCHNLERVFGMTPVVWTLHGDFWSIDRLPMTIFKPFGYSDTRTVLQIMMFWSWLLFGFLLHYRKWYMTQRTRAIEKGKIVSVSLSELEKQTRRQRSFMLKTQSSSAESGTGLEVSMSEESISQLDGDGDASSSSLVLAET